MVSITCPGCSNSFSHRAWLNHLVQTTNSACHKVHDNQRSYVPGLRLQDEFHDVLGDDDFGQDNPNISDYESPEDDSESSSSSDSKSSAFEDRDSSNPYSPESPDDDSMDDEQGQVLTPAEKENLGDSLWVKPVISDYPRRDAGRPYTNDRYSGYQDYEDVLGGEAANPYTPFLSKLDWEFARWAKLRGPGSTAASELMGIDGVRISLNMNSLQQTNRKLATGST